MADKDPPDTHPGTEEAPGCDLHKCFKGEPLQTPPVNSKQPGFGCRRLPGVLWAMLPAVLCPLGLWAAKHDAFSSILLILALSLFCVALAYWVGVADSHSQQATGQVMPHARPTCSTQCESAGGPGQAAAQPYKPAPGTRMKVMLKIPNPYSVSSLPPEAIDQLHGLMAGASSSDGLRVHMINVSVRRGCVLISGDAIAPEVDTGDAPGAVAASSSEGTLSLARQVLPRLLESLQLAEHVAHSKQLCLVMQVNQVRVRCIMSRSDSEWEFELMDPPSRLSSVPQLDLVIPAPQASPAARPAQSGRQSYWLLQVRVRCDASGCSIQGSHPAQASAVPAGSLVPASQQNSIQQDSAGFQLWCVSGTGAHLPIQVVSQFATQPGARVLQVAVQADADGLVRHHHPGGPFTILQPLCLQLWQGDEWLSSAHTLMCMNQLSAGAATYTPSGMPAPHASIRWWGWWGADDDLGGAASCALELQQWALQLQQQDADTELLQYQTLMQDVCCWLLSVRRAARLLDQCVVHDSCRITPDNPGLKYESHGYPLDHALAVATSLQEYLSSSGLSSTQQLLQRQHHLVHTAHCLVAAGDSSCTRLQRLVPWLWQHLHAVRTGMVGYSCAECESLFRSRCPAFLAQGRMMCSGGMVAFVLVVLGREAKGIWQHPAAVPVVLWAVLHMLLALCVVAKPHSHHLALLSASIVAAQLALNTMYALGVLPRLQAHQRQYERGTWVLATAVALVSERIHVLDKMPNWFIHTATLYSLVMHIINCRQALPIWLNVGGNVLAVVIAPMMFQVKVRGWVMSSFQARRL